MSINSLNIFINISKNRFSFINNVIRCYSRRISNNESSYKHVKPRRNPSLQQEETGHLVWRDPSFELLTSNEFPLFLRGNIGLAWYDTQTTLKTQHELVMEHIDDSEDSSNSNIICRVQTCPTVLRKTVKDLFPYKTIEENSELSVITVSLKPDLKLMRKNKELETEKLAQMFLIAAKNICDRLRNAGYWADFINPFSGRPYFTPTSLGDLYETDEKFRCLGFQIFEVEDCKIISSEQSSQKSFVGSLFTNAPSKKNHLNSIFTS